MSIPFSPQAMLGYGLIVLVGFVLGLVGAGGGILLVPALVAGFGLGLIDATGLSIGLVAFGAIFGLFVPVKSDGPPLTRQDWIQDIKFASRLAIPGMAGAFLMRQLILPQLPETIFGQPRDQVLLAGFILILLWIVLKRAPNSSQKSESSPFLVQVSGFGIGLLSGLFGAGGGFLYLPLLTDRLGVHPKSAVRLSLMIIAMQSAAGFASEWRRMDGFFLGLVLMLSIGVAIGAMLRSRFDGKKLKAAFRMLLIFVIFLLSYKFLNHSS